MDKLNHFFSDKPENIQEELDLLRNFEYELKDKLNNTIKTRDQIIAEGIHPYTEMENRLKSRDADANPYQLAFDYSVAYRDNYLLGIKERLSLLNQTPSILKKILNEINANQIAAYEYHLKMNHDYILFERYACIIESDNRMNHFYNLDAPDNSIKSLQYIKKTINMIRGRLLHNHEGFIGRRVSYLMKNIIDSNKVLHPDNVTHGHVFAHLALCDKLLLSGTKYRYFYQYPELWNNSTEQFFSNEILYPDSTYNILLNDELGLFGQDEYNKITKENSLEMIYRYGAFNLPHTGNEVFLMERSKRYVQF
jgi:hypothetical protein